MSNFFCGEHSTIRINLDAVDYTETLDNDGIRTPSIGSVIRVHFRSGNHIDLKHGNKYLFEEAWDKLNRSPS